jgi:hypothetical protein
VIGWLYVFGGRSGARQIVAASVIEPVAPELERIAALEDKKGFAEVVAHLHLLGTKLAYLHRRRVPHHLRHAKKVVKSGQGDKGDQKRR